MLIFYFYINPIDLDFSKQFQILHLVSSYNYMCRDFKCLNFQVQIFLSADFQGFSNLVFVVLRSIFWYVHWHQKLQDESLILQVFAIFLDSSFGITRVAVEVLLIFARWAGFLFQYLSSQKQIMKKENDYFLNEHSWIVKVFLEISFEDSFEAASFLFQSKISEVL